MLQKKRGERTINTSRVWMEGVSDKNTPHLESKDQNTRTKHLERRKGYCSQWTRLFSNSITLTLPFYDHTLCHHYCCTKIILGKLISMATYTAWLPCRDTTKPNGRTGIIVSSWFAQIFLKRFFLGQNTCLGGRGGLSEKTSNSSGVPLCHWAHYYIQPFPSRPDVLRSAPVDDPLFSISLFLIQIFCNVCLIIFFY